MQYSEFFQFGVGALLGLSAAPHCVVMCSGVATTLALAGSPAAVGRRGDVVFRGAVSNAGRVTSYVAAGGIVGTAGVAAFSWLDASLANIALRWLAAILLSVVGLSLAGIMPAMVLQYPSRMIAKLTAPKTCGIAAARSYGGLFAAGAVWGFMPCAMAYSALFYAMISGSSLSGMLTMAGFGFATTIPMMLPAFGVATLSRYGARQRVKVALGLLLAVIGIGGTFNAVHDFGVWCRA